MAFTQGFEQADALRGPRWRRSRLNGLSMAGAGITGVQRWSGPGRRRPRAADGTHAPGGSTS